jgi:hypothetical protein
MGKDKTWKLEKTLKIDDDQLKTPIHDEMCLWVDKNIHEIVDFKLWYPKTEWRETEFIPCKLNGCGDLSLQWEKPIRNGSFVIGIPDFTFYFVASVTADESAFCGRSDNVTRDCQCEGIIEVKPKIRSIGETMRQLKLYKSYIKDDTKIFLVTTEEKYRSVFESQGIHYFVVTPEMLAGIKEAQQKLEPNLEVD